MLVCTDEDLVSTKVFLRKESTRVTVEMIGAKLHLLKCAVLCEEVPWIEKYI
jgi:hypothetical protein